MVSFCMLCSGFWSCGSLNIHIGYRIRKGKMEMANVYSNLYLIFSVFGGQQS